jgi:hypothetical protein
MLRKIQGNPSISGPALVVGIVSDRVLLAGAFGGKVICGNTLANQLGHNTVGSLLGKLEILLSSANIVRMASDRRMYIRICCKSGGNIIELLL